MRRVTLAFLLGAWLIPGQAVHGAQESMSASRYRASDIMEMQVRNNADEDLGTISDLLIDEKGKIASVVLREVGILGMGEHRYVVPWNRVKITAGEKVVIIDVPKDRLDSEFSAFEPPEEAGRPGSKGKPRS